MSRALGYIHESRLYEHRNMLVELWFSSVHKHDSAFMALTLVKARNMLNHLGRKQLCCARAGSTWFGWCTKFKTSIQNFEIFLCLFHNFRIAADDNAIIPSDSCNEAQAWGWEGNARTSLYICSGMTMMFVSLIVSTLKLLTQSIKLIETYIYICFAMFAQKRAGICKSIHGLLYPTASVNAWRLLL